MSRPLVIISRNPESYLAGHSIFAWQLCEFLTRETELRVVHVTHAAADGPRHAVQITPPPAAPRYRRIEIVHRGMAKVPRSMGSCAVADALDGVLEAEARGILGVLAISPLNYLADVMNLCRPRGIPIISLLRGTDTLILGRSWGKTAAGRRYHRALEACSGIFSVSRWPGELARKYGVPVQGVVPPVTFHPFTPERLEADSDRLLNRLFPAGRHPAARVIVFAGRLSLEKGVLQVASVLHDLLEREPSMAAVMAGSGPERQGAKKILAGHITAGRAWIGPLTFPEVLALAGRTALMVMGSGLDARSRFTEAISSSSVTFAAAGVPILFLPGPRSGGIAEAVGQENRRWCESLPEVAVWPQAIVDLLKDTPRYHRIAGENRAAGDAFDIRVVTAPLLALLGIPPQEGRGDSPV